MGEQTLIHPRAEQLARLCIDEGDLLVRWVHDVSERLAIVRGVLLAPARRIDEGVMLTVRWRQGVGYAACADFSDAALNSALQRALQWARASHESGLFAGLHWPQPDARGLTFGLPSATDPGALSAFDRDLRRATIDGLRVEAEQLKSDSRIVGWSASMTLTHRRQRMYWNGQLVADQAFQFHESSLDATAHDNGLTQTRTSGGQYNGVCRQNRAGEIDASTLLAPVAGQGAIVADEALQLLLAPNCPTGTMDLLLAPDQMMLQIHESIGHPLELDRILGDERNFAGTSFVSLDMFGHYRYGSPLLNVSFDPLVHGELASFAADDEGTAAERKMLIQDGILLRPLGSPLSVRRASALGVALDSVANARSSAWYRPPIDRMGNVNVEPGDHTEQQLISRIERGVLMRTNTSWSIDDSRNKFQFGCEWGQLIDNGQLGTVVRNPNYRGVSSHFWRNLAAVGDQSTLQLHGTPYCGKGEPGQVIRVGHRAPMCLFTQVDVFGAAD